jgi:hypothetical protein
MSKKACLISGYHSFIWTDYVKLNGVYILMYKDGSEVIVTDEKELLFKGE